MNKIEIYDKLISYLNDKGVNSIYVSGIIKEATGHFIYTMSSYSNRPVLVVFENDKKAIESYEEFKWYDDNICLYPSLEISYQDLENLDYHNRMHRMDTITKIVEGKKPFIFTSGQALYKKIINKDLFIENRILIESSTVIDPYELIKSLNEMGYKKTSTVQAKGEYSIRGDILDIYQIKDQNPLRIEFFDNEIDSIRIFDINSQTSLKNIDSCILYPLEENLILKKDINNAIGSIKKEMLKYEKLLNEDLYDKLILKYSRIIENLTQGIVQNRDLILPYVSQNESNILQYLDDDYILAFSDIARVYSNFMDFEQLNNSLIAESIDHGNLLKGQVKLFNNFNNIIKSAERFKKVIFSPIVKNIRLFKVDTKAEIITIEQDSYNKRFNDFIDDLKFRQNNGYSQIIGVGDERDYEGLLEQLNQNGIYPEKTSLINFKKSSINLIKTDIKKGFIYLEDKISFISYGEIFGYRKKASKKSNRLVNKRDLINYTDLEPGDFVVHEDYGIGKYLGIKNIEVNGSKSDFLHIQYKESDTLYIPTYEMDKVGKFLGSGDKLPKLSKLNSTDWQRAKYRAKKAIEEIADDLVKLYAKRSKIKGFEFSEDTQWQKEFEAGFIYEETGAQLRAIDEIKSDMQTPRPMDRLLCGDVGYGKTEVALRAAFKAIMDGKQVVMLAPTTILVKQHFKTMVERFKNFPISIDFLSRFKNHHLKTAIKRKLKSGELDMVVGTHSLLSKDVGFKDLGLLIIDEEQRFGVKHKEKIKKISESVDTLTLSATPIPRTLQMSLSGIRDMSLLDEYPENRLPVNTYVVEFNPAIVREAILRELARGGQVYFVYNRVTGIYAMSEYLTNLVPEANIAVSHGRMSSRELENILEEFSDGAYDILLTTTIIETGMDIQNVNTIIVYNADKMGLAQLYQLKGRVGRSTRSSYSFFTYKSNLILSEIAEKRLKAIKDFSELGSGYKIAMRDLELRGAGNLLGESQSGHVESVGYDLYVRMLEEAVEKVKGIKIKDKTSVSLNLKTSSFIPDSYILDQNEKINIYKKISFISNEKEYSKLIEELIDRFGDMPTSVSNLLHVALIKAILSKAGFKEVNELENEVEIVYNSLDVFNPKKLEKLSKAYKKDLRFNLIKEPRLIIKKDQKLLTNLVTIAKIIDEINGGDYEEK